MVKRIINETEMVLEFFETTSALQSFCKKLYKLQNVEIEEEEIESSGASIDIKLNQFYLVDFEKEIWPGRAIEVKYKKL